MRRTNALQPSTSIGDGDEVPDRRPAVKELSRLGWVYGPLNQLAPLVRLAAITTYVRQSSSHPHLFPVVASIAASLALRPLNLLARRLVPDRILGTEDMPLSPGDDKGGSVSTATLRTRLLAAHLMQLVAHVTLLGVGGVDLVACGLDLGKPHAGEAGLVGAATAAVAFAVWLAIQRLLGAQRRDDLTMKGSTNDMTSSTEDELVLLMPTTHRLAFLVARCLRLALDALADLMLFFVFLVDSASDESVRSFYAATSAPPLSSVLAAALAALCYGSQHLRFKGEWLLGLGLGSALVGLARSSGDLRASYVAAALFAALRYLNRTHDVRRFHGA